MVTNMSKQQISNNELRRGWNFDQEANCIVHYEQIPDEEANDIAVFSFNSNELFVVDMFYYPESYELDWKEIPRKKYFICSYTRAIKFARKIIKKGESLGYNSTYVIGVRPITQDEYDIFENVYAHLVTEGHFNEVNFLTEEEALALPDPDYIPIIM